MTWRDLFRVHEECDWYPMMKEAELEAMAEDIEEHGLRHRVVYRLVQSELGEVAEILDGRNRLEALEIVRLPLLKDNKLNPAYFEKASQKALADIPAYIESVNLHRRHMDREQRREAILRRLKQDPKRSDRAIGQLVGADHKTVATVRAEAEGRGEIPHVSLRPDSLGRMQPTSRARPKPAVAARGPVSPLAPAGRGNHPAGDHNRGRSGPTEDRAGRANRHRQRFAGRLAGDPPAGRGYSAFMGPAANTRASRPRIRGRRPRFRRQIRPRPRQDGAGMGDRALWRLGD